MPSAQDVVNGKIGKVLGADVYSPFILEKTHPDFFWYGIHGVELLYTIMGSGCKTLTRFHTDDTEVVVGTWNDGRIGTLRCNRPQENVYGTTNGEFGGTAYGENGDEVRKNFLHRGIGEGQRIRSFPSHSTFILTNRFDKCLI